MGHWWRVVKSVLASAFGVQSQQNYSHDFQQSSFLPFLIVGVIFVAVFVLTLVLIVRSVT
ncbi:DUF2970 domain-containing protein [Fluctibacter halophilus]|uniref:DUF2970 domain-containing protein n=1 Tax=Fluctibacter halophilus TaxID=226011 RepID=UPI001E5C2D5F|nr:DUF2970 domain-containing protein [Aestuariibacter halophilus]